ncbi:MAG: TetR/AcrR family transcriptional regulator [Pseudomonadota bacterium]
MIAAAEEIIASSSFEAMRVEEVVLRAGTAKGTFFAHFKDKDALMDLIIGGRIDRYLDALEQQPAPRTAEDLAEALMPLAEFMTCERYVFDVILRYSGAAAVEDIGPIAATFGRLVEIQERWLDDAGFRSDIPTDLQAEGVQAFMLQAMATKFCALHNAQSIKERFVPYLRAWLEPN